MINKAKAAFSADSTSVFGVTLSFRNHSIVLFGAQETFLIITSVKTVMLFNIFVNFQSSKEQHLLEI